MIGQVSWILEEDAYDDGHEKLIQELRDRNQFFQVIKYSYEKISGLSPRLDAHAPVVYRGSIQGARCFQRTYGILVPGPLCEWEKYNCSYYYPKLKNHLLNKPNIMLPYGSLLENKEFLYETLGEDRAIFIRPDSGFKTFTGKLVYKENFEKDVEICGFYNVTHNAMVLVSKPHNILFEERLIVHKGKVVTGSRYRQNGQHNENSTLQQNSIDYAEFVMKDIGWEPERLWIMDLAHTKTETKVLEIGAFSVAGLYQCNIPKIVEAVNIVATEMYADIHDITL